MQVCEIPHTLLTICRQFFLNMLITKERNGLASSLQDI